MFLDIIFLSIIIGKIRGGNLRNLEKLQFRGATLFFAGFLLQFILGFIGPREWLLWDVAGSILHIASYILIFIGIYMNIGLPGMHFLGLGSLMNFIIILINGGRMPVSLDKLVYLGRIEDVQLLKESEVPMYIATKGDLLSKIFGDVFALPPPLFRSQVFSIGDILMAIGVFMLLQWVMLEKGIVLQQHSYSKDYNVNH